MSIVHRSNYAIVKEPILFENLDLQKWCTSSNCAALQRKIGRIGFVINTSSGYDNQAKLDKTQAIAASTFLRVWMEHKKG